MSIDDSFLFKNVIDTWTPRANQKNVHVSKWVFYWLGVVGVCG
jgi:hypothetical protein